MRLLIATALGLAAFCCGPRARPPVTGCPDIQCESDDLGEYDCTCSDEG